ncbi:nitrate/sulfonate/bicarbonate ABC transporter ATP-binding protein [Bordetella sp. N]|uniref:ABC transporter ATP-binding protein n=1 Tax=Bordetella sp. N TaxID=1746199 RepID=UPI00070AF531|nr:nitrate/sulfonate/bicarbonate ABC transporter ATP-binding protein [Bordetella sp. N]ALM82620.1 nitrate ABC transporter ATP-binding protein [Bordetella sp. N]
MNGKANFLLDLKGVSKMFQTADGTNRSVLEDVDFQLRDGEIVALLGKSGSGKSTLLRIMAGLIPADQGQISYRGQPLYGPASGVAMVFQSFALFPWLTVRQNVALGLEAQGISLTEREQRAEAALELIGLAGFGGALPRELSGGMRQRVGIARALATDPDVLLMDEAFSALDVLTGETLRDDMLELWDERRISTRGILVVSHNIEEAVMMADRILIFASDPGRVRDEIRVQLPRPRNADSAEVRALVDQVYGLMTARPVPASKTGAPAQEVHSGYRLPDANVGRMEEVLELLAEPPLNGRADLPRLAEEAGLPDEELFPAYEALGLLGLALVEHGDITLTTDGRRYAAADQQERQELFGRQLLAHIPLAANIRHSLEQEATGELPERQFLEMLEEFLKPDEAERVLKVAVEWGRYGEVYGYDYHTGRLHLPTTPGGESD